MKTRTHKPANATQRARAAAKDRLNAAEAERKAAGIALRALDARRGTRPRRRYYKLPAFLAQVRELTGKAPVVLTLILDHIGANKVGFPGQRTLEVEAGCWRSNIKEIIKRLFRDGFLVEVEAGRGGHTTRYAAGPVLALLEAAWAETEPVRLRKTFPDSASEIIKEARGEGLKQAQGEGLKQAQGRGRNRPKGGGETGPERIASERITTRTENNVERSLGVEKARRRFLLPEVADKEEDLDEPRHPNRSEQDLDESDLAKQDRAERIQALAHQYRTSRPARPWLEEEPKQEYGPLLGHPNHATRMTPEELAAEAAEERYAERRSIQRRLVGGNGGGNGGGRRVSRRGV